MSLKCRPLTMAAISFCLATSLFGQPYKAVFYHPYEGAMLFQSLADDSGPRAQAVKMLDQNFQNIHNALGATAIVVRLTDENDYVGEGGGGAPYYPLAGGDPKPQFAVGQEIVLDIAQKWGLKVFFMIEPSYWHLVQGNDKDGVAPGSWDFIHSLIDPTVYYGNPCTTEMSLVGLTDTCVRTYYNDSRIAGWMLGKEWDAVYNNANVSYYLSTYWNFFYQLVHWNGSTTPAMIYTFGTDADSG